MVELKQYYYVQNLLLQKECILLQSLLDNLGIKTTLKIRNKDKDLYRIRFSNTSIPLVRELVKPYIHKDFIYKLGY
jgi:hypothetical protein